MVIYFTGKGATPFGKEKYYPERFSREKACIGALYGEIDAKVAMRKRLRCWRGGCLGEEWGKGAF
jgi:hypothetical protein